ncbi:MAG: hypothetical protein SCJ97_11655, partial [Bacillota bacterium]|nr:hypothetical protein [Bacillota bacterium]
FTYIGDVVEANLAAAIAPAAVGRVFNIGGGTRISVNGVLELLKKISGKEFKVRYEPFQAGDPMHTYADTTRARKELKFTPQTTLEQGLTHMLNSFK